MNVWGITHRGMVREQNQDAFACRTLPDGRIIALVCDGMGGARAGNIASTMAVELFMEEFLSRKEDESDRVRMERAASRANDEVFHRSNVDMECSGMGTTLVAALAGPHETVILNEGDSRAYHPRRHHPGHQGPLAGGRSGGTRGSDPRSGQSPSS